MRINFKKKRQIWSWLAFCGLPDGNVLWVSISFHRNRVIIVCMVYS